MGNATLSRRDTAAGFVSGNPVLADGEHGYETDTEATKIGDGVTAWVGLAYSWPNPTAGSLNATFIPRWQPLTAYALGAKVVSPAGDTVTAKVAFTSGASYDATNWDLPTTLSGKLDKSEAEKKYAPSTLRRRSFPGFSGLPLVNAGATIVTTVGTDVSSSITGAVFVPYSTGGKWTTRGPRLVKKLGASSGLTPATTLSSLSCWALETVLDTTAGVLEVVTGRANARVMVDGTLLSAADSITASPGVNSRVTTKISGLTTGRHLIRFEFSGSDTFCGFNIAPTDALSSASRHRTRTAIVGDSFTQPTIVDATPSNTWMGYGMQIGYMLDTDVITYGWGGSGYREAGTSSVGNYLTRWPDIASDLPDRVIFTGGLNDYGKAGFTWQTEHDAALAVFQAARAVLPALDQIIVVSPYWKGGYSTIPAGLITARDAIKQAAFEVGAVYVETLTPPVIVTPLIGTVMGTNNAGVTGINASAYLYELSQATYLLIGTPGGINSEVVKVGGVGGSSAPYFLNMSPVKLQYQHLDGEPITRVSESMYSGTGAAGQRVVTDGVTTSGSATLTSATATFTTADIGSYITGAGIPAGTKVLFYTNATQITMSATATATASGVTVAITNQKGDGNADRFTGSDGTHPTIAGHLHIATNVFSVITEALRTLS